VACHGTWCCLLPIMRRRNVAITATVVTAAVSAAAVYHFAGQLQRSLLYFPRRYQDIATASFYQREVEFARSKGFDIKEVNYVGKEGAGKAFLAGMEPDLNGSALWVVFGGNAMLALDWLELLVSMSPSLEHPKPSFLLMDYPSFGDTEGTPCESSVLNNARKALEVVLAMDLGSPSELRILGHSLGASAAFMLANSVVKDGIPTAKDLKLGRLVVSAPFKSCPEMAKALLNIPLPIAKVLLPQQWDNQAYLRAIQQARWDGTLSFIVPKYDEIVPPAHGLALHKQAKGMHLELWEPQADHNDALIHDLPRTIRAMGYKASL